ncbi:RxLR effector protein [Phytophthora megakarya]|uniref:RxLR effector protein n=1 Tax=Phytophthora megakarya TaxID=4795 RepID=A0A225W276_9STRA|nr:RxLR effector protein [Phytophthora megakarya]
MLNEQLREKRGTPVTTSQAVGVAELWEAHSVGLVPSEVERDNIKSIISAGAARSSSYQLDEDKIRFSTQTITTRQLTAEQTEFLMNSQWNDNGCVINEKGKSLKENDYPAIRPTKIRDIVVDLEPERTMAGEYAATITVPMVEGKELRAHLRQAAKWCRNVMISIPWQAWDQDHSEIKAINQPQLSEKLTWRKGKERNTVAATTSRAGDTRQVLTVRRTQNGLSWEVEAVDDQFRRSPDYLLIEEWEFYCGIAFQATLETADYPWIQQQPGTAKTLSFILRKQRTKHFRRKSKHKMEPVLEQIKKFVSASKWGNAASVQTPRQLWRTQGLFTDYQNWTIYRLALGKVNLYHAGWPEYRDCSALQFNCNEETIDHIMWECRRLELLGKYG